MTDRRKTAQEIAQEIANALDRKTNTKFILDADHNTVPCDLMTWARWYEESENRRVALTITEHYEISTIFMGVDHNWSGTGPPILFETMVFARDKGEQGDERDCERWSTWDEAMAGHEAMVRKVTAKAES